MNISPVHCSFRSGENLKRDLYQKTGAICRVKRRKSTKNTDIVY
ncbi:hypothetical protein VCRLGP8_370185 [Vibrio crassostreae]|nr:hypothetical protein VCRLGP107_170185 [Vibrio crassostreae]CDT47219.1 hypothetical protein VCRLGP8_370185 [Vibrio crassostreae]CDT65847.1 hypothetical protein VCRLGP7_920136 [Vibrio crassostreae]